MSHPANLTGFEGLFNFVGTQADGELDMQTTGTNGVVLLVVAGVLGCGRPAHEAFFDELQALCGQAFVGRMIQGAAADSAFRNNQLIMHVRQCSDEEIRIPLHVGEDRSRTWVISRTTTGLQLRHDHRHQDGTPEELSQYGGVSEDGGRPTRLEFPADMHTATMVPEAAANVWTLEIVPGETLVYALRREGTDRRVRLEFDLAEPTDTPPAPWGTSPPI